MEKYISQTNLEHFYKNEVKELGKKGVQEQIRQTQKERKSSDKSRVIFLSHCHFDKTIVDKISLLFSKLDTEVYVDWLDNTLPEKTNKTTAEAIKTKIRECNHFLFLATYRALRSKWCNWEIGIADSINSESKIAILPIETRSGNWAGNEYLHLYPEMRFDTDNLDLLTEEDIKIHQLNGHVISLKNWLT